METKINSRVIIALFIKKAIVPDYNQVERETEE